MENYTNTALAILEKAGVVTHDGATQLSKDLVTKIHQHRYEDSLAMVEEVIEKYKDFAAQPWQTDIARLERRIVSLEQQLGAKVEAKVAKHKAG